MNLITPMWSKLYNMSKKNVKKNIKRNNKSRVDMIDFGVNISKYINNYRKLNTMLWDIDTELGFLNIISLVSPETITSFRFDENKINKIKSFFLKVEKKTGDSNFKFEHYIVNKLHCINNISKTKILWKYIPKKIRDLYVELASGGENIYFDGIMRSLLMYLNLPEDVYFS